MAQLGSNAINGSATVETDVKLLKYPTYIQPFDVTKPGSWRIWLRRFSVSLRASGLHNASDEDRVAHLLTAMGDKAYTLSHSLTSPKFPEDLKYDELVKVITDHLAPTPSCFLARYQFHKRMQSDSESISDYSAALRELGVYCEFGECLEHSLRDQFIVGIKNSALQEKFFKKTLDDVTFNSAVGDATAAEKAKGECNVLKNSTVSYVTNNWSKKKSNNLLKKTNVLKCFGCGEPHLRSDCPHKTARCRNCHKRGHILKVCKSASVKSVNEAKSTTSTTTSVQSDNPKSPNTSMINAGNSINKIDATHPINTTVLLGENETPINFEVDTGSPHTFLTSYDLNFLGINEDELLFYSGSFNSYSKDPLITLGSVNLKVRYKKFIGYLSAFVVKGPSYNLLGRSWFESLGIEVTGVAHIQNLTDQYIHMFPSVFSDKLGEFTGPPIDLELNPDIKPIACAPRRIPIGIRPAVDEALDKLIKSKVLEPVEDSDWATPIVPVVKPDGSVRICADYRITINKAIKPKHHEIPVVSHLLAEIGQEAKVFAKLDLSQAYLQMTVTDKTARAQTIITHRGKFKCNRLQFGVNAAPGEFQSRMLRLIRDLKGVLNYFDDFLIYARNHNELFDRTTKVLSRFNDIGLHIRAEKCIFSTNAVDFLGYNITSNGIRPTSKLYNAILYAPIPDNKNTLQSFLGLLNFYHTFLPMKADVIEPLHELLRKNTKWSWTNVHQKSFDAVKQLLTSNKLLICFDSTKEIILTVDASPIGVGAVLAHRMPDGKELPVAFHSKALTSAEKNYSQLDREALAIITGVKKFHHFLYGHKFTIITDHKPLLGIFSSNKPIPDIISPRMLRWSIILSAYNYELIHRPGKLISHADALSRSPINDTDLQTNKAVNLLESWGDTPLSVVEIAEQSASDPIIQTVIGWVINGWPNKTPTDDYLPYFRKRNELSIMENCLLWGSRIVLPSIMHSKILNLIHSSHPGVVRMKSLARSYVWWPGIDKQIEKFVSNCKACQVYQNAPHACEPYPWPKPASPWIRIHIDHAGPFNGKLLLIVVDAYSKWVEVRLVNSTNTVSTIKMLRELFSTFGIPEVIVSDNATGFTSEEFKKFLVSNGIQFVNSPPFHPSSNGRAERAVRSIKNSRWKPRASRQHKFRGKLF